MREAQRDLSVSLDRIGDVKLQAGDRAGALAAYEESLAIRRKLAEADPGNAEAQRDLSVSLDKIGDVKLQAGDRAGALAAYEESLAIRPQAGGGRPRQCAGAARPVGEPRQDRRREAPGGRPRRRARRL